MKKVLKIVGVIFILLIAAIVILPIIFKDDIIQLNILPPTKYLRATETIQEQIDFVQKLEEKTGST